MAKKKRITRKQLLKQPDEFMTFSGKLISYFTENKKSIAIVLCAVFIFIFAVSALNYFSKKQEVKAFDLLYNSMAKYETLKDKEKPETACQEVENDFKSIFDKYPRKMGGKLARIFFANACYQAKKYDNAIELYSISLKDFAGDPLFKNLVLNSIAYSYEGKKDYKKAVKNFQMISTGDEPVMKGDAFFNLGMLYEKLGETDKSIEAYKKIVSDYKDTVYVEIAKKKVSG